MHGPEAEGLEGDPRRDGAVLEATDPTPAGAGVEVAGEECERALPTRPVPDLRELGVVVRAAVEELDRGAMAGERVVELAEHRLELPAHVPDPRAGERGGPARAGAFLRAA